MVCYMDSFNFTCDLMSQHLLIFPENVARKIIKDHMILHRMHYLLKIVCGILVQYSIISIVLN
jgi:hypothetical protein